MGEKAKGNGNRSSKTPARTVRQFLLRPQIDGQVERDLRLRAERGRPVGSQEARLRKVNNKKLTQKIRVGRSGYCLVFLNRDLFSQSIGLLESYLALSFSFDCPLSLSDPSIVSPVTPPLSKACSYHSGPAAFCSCRRDPESKPSQSASS